MRYQWTKLDAMLLAVLVFMIVPGIVNLVRSRTVEEDAPDIAETSHPGSPAQSVNIEPGTTDPVTHPALDKEWAPAPEWERESDRWVLVQQQADAMRRYAEQADADDPFALTEEEIRAFEEVGDPVLW